MSRMEAWRPLCRNDRRFKLGKQPDKHGLFFQLRSSSIMPFRPNAAGILIYATTPSVITARTASPISASRSAWLTAVSRAPASPLSGWFCD